MFRNMDVITFDSETGNVSDYLFNLNNSSCHPAIICLLWGDFIQSRWNSNFSYDKIFGEVLRR